MSRSIRPRRGGGAPAVAESLARTATAYGQALSPRRRALPGGQDGGARGAEPPRAPDGPALLRDWTARVLRPLDALPHHIRAELLATTRLGLEFTAVNTAKVLGVSRNTVRAHMERVESLLRTDFTDLIIRAVVHLAINNPGQHRGQTGWRRPRAARRAARRPAGWACRAHLGT